MRVGPPRGGFTLVEALVAMVLLALVGQTLLRIITVSQRLFRAQGERAALQASLRAGASLLAGELRPAGPGDLLAVLPDEVVYRAPRLTAVACAVGPGSVAVRRRLHYGYRDLVAGRDSLLVFRDNDPATDADDRWEPVAVSGSETPGSCPDGSPARIVPATVPPDLAALSLADVPVRAFEVMQLRLYQSGGQYWIGMRSLSGGEAQVQPAVGPLAADGLRLSYRTAAGTLATAPADVRFIGLTIRGVSDGAVVELTGQVAFAADSLAGAVELRNAE
jgi:type II secretory pathway pseudopilin PulG